MAHYETPLMPAHDVAAGAQESMSLYGKLTLEAKHLHHGPPYI
jgi:hypothetical protein